MEKKEQVYQHIRSDTITKLKEEQFESLGLDTLTVSLDLKMNRANISRLLNQLYNEGRLIKTDSRPVFFMDRSALDRYVEHAYIPSIIPKDKTIKDYLATANASASKVRQDHINTFNRYITNLRHSKMAEPVRKAKSAILYPSGLNTLIIGDRGTGRFQFAKAMSNYARNAHFIDDKKKVHIVECLNYSGAPDNTLLKLLFGEYIAKTNTWKRGLFQQSSNHIIIMNNIDQLPSGVLSSLYNAILDKSFSPINSSKTIPLSSLIIATASTAVLRNDGDLRRCFPMFIDMPNLYERSIVEKLVIIMQYLQDEALTIDKTIRISKDALSCLTMSEYSGNLAHQRSEIRQACASGYQRYIEENSMFIDIDLDDLSTPVLENIFNVDDHIAELNETLNLFSTEYFFFSAQKLNPELQLLYDLDQPNKNDNPLTVRKVGDELINQCISDIESAANSQLNSLRSVMLQSLYDTIHPIVQNHAICKSENLLYGLLLHISGELNNLKSGVTSSTVSLNNKIARGSDYAYASRISSTLNETDHVKLPSIEVDYIATYLYLSSQWIDRRYIQLLIISSGREISRNYADFINGQKFKTHASYMTVSEDEPAEAIMHEIAEKMRKIDRSRGVIIITDQSIIPKHSSLISKHFSGKYTIVEDMTIQKIVSIAEHVESLGATIQSSNAFDSLTTEQVTAETSVETPAQELLQNIQEKLLSESLVFLNPEKACQALFHVLLNILQDLSIPYSDDLLIKFIFHTSFALERCIRKEPFVYPKARILIKQHATLFNVLEKNFEIITELFSVQIPASEMGYVIEIFLPYYQQNEES